MGLKLAFKAKDVPLVTKGRIQHLAFGLICGVACGLVSVLVFHDPFSWGAAWGLVVAFLYGLIWEMATPILAKEIFRGWTHPFGDYLDFVYYVAGALVLALGTSLGGC